MWIEFYKLLSLASSGSIAIAMQVETISMTCYFRHLQEVFRKAGIEVTSENKHEVDRVLHNMVGVKYKNCSSAWKEIKKRISEDEECFVSDLRKALTLNQ
jgi:hypothetical protein